MIKYVCVYICTVNNKYIYKYHIYIYTCTIHTHHQGFSVPDTLGRAAAARGAGAPWRSSGVASVGAGVAEPWKLRKNSRVLLSPGIAPLVFLDLFEDFFGCQPFQKIGK